MLTRRQSETALRPNPATMREVAAEAVEPAGIRVRICVAEFAARIADADALDRLGPMASFRDDAKEARADQDSIGRIAVRERLSRRPRREPVQPTTHAWAKSNAIGVSVMRFGVSIHKG